MQICCSICKDIFIPHSEVSVTSCGHLYHETCISVWFKQKSTCPQCRAKLKQPAHRVYFDVENDTDTDPSSLQYKIDKLSYTLQLKNSEVTKLHDEVSESKTKQAALKVHAQTVECMLQKSKDTNFALKEEIKFLQKDTAKVEEMKKKYEIMMSQVETLQNVDILIKGTVEEVNKMVKSTAVSPIAIRQLCTYVEILKRKIKETEIKKNKYAKENQRAIKEIHSQKLEISSLLEQVDELKVINMVHAEEIEKLKLTLSDQKAADIDKTVVNTSAAEKENTSVEIPKKPQKALFSLDAKVINNLVKKPGVRAPPGVSRPPFASTSGAGVKRPLKDSISHRPMSKRPLPARSDNFVSDGMGGSTKISLAFPTPSDELAATVQNHKAKLEELKKLMKPTSAKQEARLEFFSLNK